MNNYSAEWLLDSPLHWPRLRLKSVLDSVTNGFWGEEPAGDENDVVCLRVADFDYERLRVSNEKLTLRKILPKDADSRLLKPGDILLEKSGGGEKQPVGRAVLFTGTERAVSSNFVARLRTKPLVANSDFLSYYMFALYSLRVNLRSINQTTGIQNLDGESFFNEPIALPPLPEQRSIARFLDDKTAKIDTLIEKKRRLIELLKEERQAVINSAVTKGLNPNAKMKPSGIEWLGDVPVGWEVKKLKYLSPQVTVGLVINPSTYHSENGTVPMITAKHLRPYQISIEGADKISSEDNERLSASQILEGDVVVVRVGYPGDSAVVPKSLSGINCASLLIVRKPEGIRSEFLCHALNSFIGRTQIDLSQYGSAQKVCNVGDLKEFLIPVPARIEQEAIIAFLDSKTNEIATLIEKAERAIALLTEYRTALITEAVTGRVEVRYSNAITPYTKDINNGTV